MDRSVCQVACATLFVGIIAASPARAEETVEQQCVVSVERIWDRPAHAAFTDIVAHGDYLYCTFREGSGHIPGLNGVVRVLRSRDRMNWESVALLAEEGVDLRDPKLSITPDERILVNMGASYYHGSERQKIQSRVAFSDSAGEHFSAPVRAELPPDIVTGHDWLWRLTWHGGTAWGCVQQVPPNGERSMWLVRSDDGIHFQHVTQLDVDGPSETTLRFEDDGTLVAMIRGEGDPKIGYVGTAEAPYTDWNIKQSNKRFGGPNFVDLGVGTWLSGSRAYGGGAKTELRWLDVESARCQPILVLPSGGDNSYPGFVVDEDRNLVYVSYYSSHEGKAAIYLATLRLDGLRGLAP